MDAYAEQVKSIEAEMKSPLPTPPVGTMVVWYPRAEVKPNAEIAAIVTAVESPGKIKLVVWRPNGMPEHKIACLHVSHRQHQQRANAASVNNGAWDYPEFYVVPGGHYKADMERLARKLEAVKQQQKDLVAARSKAEKQPA